MKLQPSPALKRVGVGLPDIEICGEDSAVADLGDDFTRRRGPSGPASLPSIPSGQHGRPSPAALGELTVDQEAGEE